MKSLRTGWFAALALIFAVPAFAQSGCVNSPENPTALLAVVGTAAGFFSYARARRDRRKKRQIEK